MGACAMRNWLHAYDLFKNKYNKTTKKIMVLLFLLQITRMDIYENYSKPSTIKLCLKRF
jgi:hypothetical protein